MEDNRIKKQPKKHLWKPEEDLILKKYVETHGEGNWATVSQRSGLKRGGKSCRLRWKNYLRPNIKRGDMSEEEQDLIIRMHKLLGNRWSLIAGRLPGRTDNEVKNYWNTHLNKRCSRGKSKHAETTHKKLGDISCTFLAKSTKGETNEPEEQRKVEEEKSLSTTSTESETKGLNCGSEFALTSPMFLFEDEPFAAYMDPFLFFEAYAEMGMQSVIS